MLLPNQGSRDRSHQYAGSICTLLLQPPTSPVSVSSVQVLIYTLHCATNSSWTLRCNAASVCPPAWPAADLCSLQAVPRREACVSPKSRRPAPARRRTFTLTRSCTTPLSWLRRKTTATSWWRCVCVYTTPPSTPPSLPPSSRLTLIPIPPLQSSVSEFYPVESVLFTSTLSVWLSASRPLFSTVRLLCPKTLLELGRPRFIVCVCLESGWSSSCPANASAAPVHTVGLNWSAPQTRLQIFHNL